MKKRKKKKYTTKIKFERSDDYPIEGSIALTYYDHAGEILIGAEISPENEDDIKSKYVYSEFDDAVSGVNSRKFKNKKLALQFLLKQRKKLKQEAQDRWREAYVEGY